MNVYLLSLGLEGDCDAYADLLADRGIVMPDDLLLEEPSLEDLEEMGIESESDRQKIYAVIHPELAVNDSTKTGTRTLFKPCSFTQWPNSAH